MKLIQQYQSCNTPGTTLRVVNYCYYVGLFPILIYNYWLLLRLIQGSIVPRYMIFTEAEAEVNIIYLGTIDPYINRNESQ